MDFTLTKLQNLNIELHYLTNQLKMARLFSTRKDYINNLEEQIKMVAKHIKLVEKEL